MVGVSFAGSAQAAKGPRKVKGAKAPTVALKPSAPKNAKGISAPVAPAGSIPADSSFTVTESIWERSEKPALQIPWRVSGPPLEALQVVAVGGPSDPPVSIRLPSNSVIKLDGLNPFSSYTVDVSPIWRGIGVGKAVRLLVPAAAKGPHPQVGHPDALQKVKLIGARPNPCMPIHWRYNPAREQFGDALARITVAMKNVSDATGIEMIYDGATDSYDTSGGNYTSDTVDVEHPRTWMLIQWEDPAKPVEENKDTEESVVLGVGSPGFKRFRAGFPNEFSDGASVSLRVNKSLADPSVFMITVLHEVGHSIGLDHSDDPASIMYPVNQGQTDWTAADREALAAIGRPGAVACIA